jgi:hypothetical protein
MLQAKAWDPGGRLRATAHIHITACPVLLQVCGSRSGAVDKLDLDFVYHLQTPLNCLPEDAAILMELRHWKADKKKVRSSCPDCLLSPAAAPVTKFTEL